MTRAGFTEQKQHESFGIKQKQAGSVPLALLVAMMRHRLFGVELIIRRSLVWAGLTAGVVGVYTAVVGGASALLGLSGTVPSLVATALVAVLFQPARERLQRAAEKLVIGGRRDPHLALSQLGRHLQSAVGREDGLAGIAETVVQALRLPYIRIDLAGNAGAGEAGTRVADVATMALVHRGRSESVTWSSGCAEVSGASAPSTAASSTSWRRSSRQPCTPWRSQLKSAAHESGSWQPVRRSAVACGAISTTDLDRPSPGSQWRSKRRGISWRSIRQRLSMS